MRRDLKGAVGPTFRNEQEEKPVKIAQKKEAKSGLPMAILRSWVLVHRHGEW